MHYLLVSTTLVFTFLRAQCAEEAEHRDFQYNSVVDPLSGRYNFAYDTGLDNDIAHSLHMQYRDVNGVVRGRYGYTDPRGKLRMVEYEAGPGGFVARGDVGPDEFPHDQAPSVTVAPSQVGRYVQDDLDLAPRPVQMAGWDPAVDPMGQPVTGGQGSSSGIGAGDGGGQSTSNPTSPEEVEVSSGVLSYDQRYPRIYTNTNTNANTESEDLKEGDSGEGDTNREQYPVAGPVNVNTIDVNPDNIRTSTGSKENNETNPRSPRDLPYSYRNYRPSSDVSAQSTGYRVVYRPDHDHYHERHYTRIPTHDHDAERRYVSRQQTHDHDAERRYYVANRNRQTHDHDAERPYYYVRNRQTHDHDAERPYYYTRDGNYWRRNYYPSRRRIFYRDSHSMVPHEHYSDVYRNDNDRYHQHSDRHLYGRSQNLEVPATAKPRQLVYVPSDKYHDKYYYWSS